MKLTLAETGYFKDSISIISELVNEGKFRINKDGIEMVAMDPANVAMVIFKLLSSCFTEYHVTKEIEVNINLANLKQVLRRISANDVLTLEVTEDNKLNIEMKGKVKRTFSLPLLAADEKEQRIPDLKFDAVVEIDTSILDNAIGDSEIIGEAITFIVDKDVFYINAEGDLSKSSTLIDPANNDKIKLKVAKGKDKIRSRYSIEYLKKIIGASKLTDTVKIQFSKDYPLRVDYREVDKVQLDFILAPRVDND